IFWAAENGYDAVISSNTFDPGVDGGRLAVNIPVIGLLRTSMHAALTLADRVGITVPLPGHVPYTWRILRSYGLDGFVSDIPPLRHLRQGYREKEESILRDHREAHPRPNRRDPRRDHPATRRRAHSLCGQSGRPRESDGRTGAQHQGDRHPLCRDVRRPRHDA